MKFQLTVIFIFLTIFCFGQTTVKIVSWNLKDFGKSKTDKELGIVADLTKGYDILAIQEVVAGYGGPQAVARLADALSRKGAKWNYVVSDVTSVNVGNKAERYAFIWNTAKVRKIGLSWLESTYKELIEREPFYGRFEIGSKKITVVDFHAITKSHQPEREIKYFKFLPAQYPKDNLIFCGDFNIPQSHSVFNPVRKMGYKSALIGQKTTLRQRCLNGDCLASEFDNFYFNGSKISLKSAGVVHFYKLFASLKLARKLSDHIPIFAVFELK
ncbi:deoxyribonuclease-1-like protein [Pedobacter sp. UYP30]|uniref:endonuclease/exonuclease/phosphatase family protein n=1 Tax=Pedobacter sp. UYP30 TaxID=1756400 RepID=UPI0033983DA0